MNLSVGAATTLAEAPANVFCRIESTDSTIQSLGYYVSLGLRRGAIARILAKWPESAPRLLEVELGNNLVSLPVSLAGCIVVQPCSV